MIKYENSLIAVKRFNTIIYPSLDFPVCPTNHYKLIQILSFTCPQKT